MKGWTELKKKVKKWLYKEVKVELLAYRFNLKDGTTHYTKQGWTGVGSHRVPSLIGELAKRTMHQVTGVGMVPNQQIVSIAVVPIAKGKAKIKRSTSRYDTNFEYVQASQVYGIEELEGKKDGKA